MSDRYSGSHIKLFKSRVKTGHMICWLTLTSSYCSAFRLWLKSWRLRRFLSCFARWSSCFCRRETGSSYLTLCSVVKHGVENSSCVQCKEASEDKNGNYTVPPVQSINITWSSSLCIVIKPQRVPQWDINVPENSATRFYWLYVWCIHNWNQVMEHYCIVVTFYFQLFLASGDHGQFSSK